MQPKSHILLTGVMNERSEFPRTSQITEIIDTSQIMADKNSNFLIRRSSKSALYVGSC